MIRIPRPPLALALAVALAAAGVHALAAGARPDEEYTVKLRLRTDAGAETVELEDLDHLAVGETRTFHSGSGRPVVVTRDDDGYTVDLGERTLHLAAGDSFDDWPGHRAHRLRRIEIDGDGGSKIVLGGEPVERRVILRRLGEDDESLHVAPGRRLHHMERIEIDSDGGKTFVLSDEPELHHWFARDAEDGDHGFAFSTGGSLPEFLFAGPRLLDRVEKHEKFLAFDEATRDAVREIVRDAVKPMEWVEREGGDGDPVEIVIERRQRSTDEDDD